MAAVAFIVYGLSPTVTNGDSYLSFPTAVSMVHQRNLELSEFKSPLVQGHYGIWRVKGGRYDVYPWVVSAVFIPTVLALDAAHAVGIGPGSTELVERDAMGGPQLLVASFVTALSVALMYELVRRRSRLRESRRAAVAAAVAIAYAFGTAAWSTASRALWQHGPSMTLLAAALLVADGCLRDEEEGATRWLALGAICGAAYTVRPTNSLVVVAFAVWLLTLEGNRLRRLLFYVAGGAAVAVPWLAVNVVSYGTVLPKYFNAGRLSFGMEWLDALAANMVSPSRGLLAFSPVVLVAVAGLLVARLRGRRDSLMVVSAVLVVAYWIVVSANNEGWWAGHSIGPRLLSDIVPLLMFVMIPAVDRLVDLGLDRQFIPSHALVVLLLVWSVAANGQGAALRSANCWNVEPNNINYHPGRVWDVSDAQVVYGFRAFLNRPARQAVLGPCKR